MKEELNALLFEYQQKFKNFADSADYLTEPVKKEMQNIMLKEFRNELKLLQKREERVNKANNLFQRLVNKWLRREVKEEAKLIRKFSPEDIIEETYDEDHDDVLEEIASDEQKVEIDDTESDELSEEEPIDEFAEEEVSAESVEKITSNAPTYKQGKSVYKQESLFSEEEKKTNKNT